MIHLFNFADEKFRKIQIESTKRATKTGDIDIVHEFSPTDIDEKFKNDHSKILSNKRGAGLWLWKPYFTDKLLSEISEDDFLIYCDSGVSFIHSVCPLIRLMDRENIDMMFFGLPLLEVEWTKDDAYKIADCKKNYNDRQVDGSFFIIRPTVCSKRIIKEWLDLCCSYDAICPLESKEPYVRGKIQFRQHREDQSILSLVLHRNGIRFYRDPSDYGEFPFQYKSANWTYAPTSYTHSYPTITLHHRSADFATYKKNYILKHWLSKIGLWNELINDLKNK